MKVAIALPLRRGASGGFVKHLVELLARWSLPGTGLAIDVVLPEAVLDEVTFRDVGVIRTDKDDFRNGFRHMGKAISNGGYDVCLLTLPRVVPIEGVPVVSIVQNVEPLQKARYSMPILWRMRLWALRREQLKAFQRSDRIIAISQHVKDMLLLFKVSSADKIDVIYHGFDTKELLDSNKPAVIPAVPFIFAAGSVVPYRGFEDIIKAVSILKKRDLGELDVFFTGDQSDSSWYGRRLHKLIQNNDASGWVKWAGTLTRSEMNWCYQHCRLFVITSRAEAFGNIVLEAMGHGCEVISCDNPPMPEILGDCAEYYPIGDSSRLAELVEKHLRSESHPKGKRSLASERTAGFSWDATASQTLAALRMAAK